MKVEISELEAFVAVAELGNFQRAAERLHLTQPGLSRRVQKLEQSLGVELLHRTTRSVELTGIGRHFLPMAREQIKQLESMLSSIHSIAERRFGKIRFSSIPTVVTHLLPGVLKNYAEIYPKVGVQIYDGNHDFVVAQVKSGAAEFGISMDPGQDDDLIFTPLLTDDYVVAVHQSDTLSTAGEVSLDALAAKRLIIGGRDSGNRLLLELLLGSAAVQFRWFYEVEHISCVIELVEAGVGCAIIPALALPLHRKSAIVAVPFASPNVRRVIGIIRSRSKSISPFATEFLKLFNEHVAAP